MCVSHIRPSNDGTNIEFMAEIRHGDKIKHLHRESFIIYWWTVEGTLSDYLSLNSFQQTSKSYQCEYGQNNSLTIISTITFPPPP